MIQCKKCHEYIGDNVNECPFCKSVITDEDRKEAIAENERVHLEAIKGSMEEYSKRTKHEIIVAVIMAITAIIGLILIAVFDLNVIWGLLLFALIIVFYVLCAFKLRIGLCPYCESFMGRGMFGRTHCPRCGGRLR